MKKLTPACIARLALILIGAAATPLVNATIMAIELTGYVNGKPAPFLNSTSVKVGDTFGFAFQFDDAEQTSQPYFANGLTYTQINQPISPSLTGWSGTLSNEFARLSRPENGSISGYGNIASIYRGPTLEHDEWVFTSTEGAYIHLVTRREGNLGYGWWGIGGAGPFNSWLTPDYPAPIDYAFISITGLHVSPIPIVPETVSPVSAVPEASSALLFLAGISALVLVQRRNKRNTPAS